MTGSLTQNVSGSFSPDNDIENALGGQKEKQFHVQVVPEEKPEEMTITIS
jgi:hypothetical protein